jgi:hypothetical protein
MAMFELRSHVDAGALVTVDRLAAEIRGERTRLPVVFPSLPRRFGRSLGQSGRQRIGAGEVDLRAFRTCDLAAACILSAVAATAAELLDLYAHGDIEERAMLLRSLHFLPIDDTTVRLFGEVQRTNVVLHLEAALCDGDLLARAIDQAALDRAAANRLLLKLAFLDMPLSRAFGAERAANAELSRMLQDLATEREAAGRAVWRDTLRLIGRAPCPGTAARLIGGLEHGDDGVRLAAAEGLLSLDRRDLAQFAAERLPRETREPVRAALRRISHTTT